MIFADVDDRKPAYRYPCNVCGKNIAINWDDLICYIQIECARLGWELPVRWTFSIPHDSHVYLAEMRLDETAMGFADHLKEPAVAHEGRTELKVNPFP